MSTLSQDHLVALKRLLDETLHPLNAVLKLDDSMVEQHLELTVFFNQLTDDLVSFGSTGNYNDDPTFLDRFATALITQSAIDASTMILRIEQLGANIGQRLNLIGLPDDERLRIGRKLSHQLMLLRMKLAQHNITNYKPGSPASNDKL